MTWDFDAIKARRLAKAKAAFSALDRDALIDRIAEAEACLVTMTAALADLDITGDGRASVFVSSKLFPEQPDGMSDDEVRVFDHVKGDFIVVKTTPSEMHGIDYETAESIHVTERDRLHDDFEILSVHESGLAYCFCGSITMGDVRRAAKLLWGPGR